jgi:predicted acylesterase/phospholipase RssA
MALEPQPATLADAPAYQPPDSASLIGAARATRKLAPSDVRYLAFEGGGGKGFAYLGVLEVLEALKILTYTKEESLDPTGQIKGVGGASAGAITALLVSLGYNTARLRRLMLHDADFKSFFTPPRPRLRPVVGGVKTVRNPATHDERDTTLERFLDEAFSLTRADVLLLIEGLGLISADVREWLKQHRQQPPLDLLLSDQFFSHYLAYLGRDMGLFHGAPARVLFDSLISQRILSVKHGKERVSNPTNVTFQEHYDLFGIKLVLTGTNLSTGATQLFSTTDTPDFPVADAVRISMSLPLLFKPYVLDQDMYKGRPPCGTYVDGGLWNNLPFREFEVGDNYGKTKRPRTLGLRLGIEAGERVHSLSDLFKRILYFGLMGSGESQVLQKYADQMIVVDTRGLDLVDFNPEPATRDRAIKRAARTAWRYWGIESAKHADPADDRASEDLQARMSACRGMDE